jgi:hypothetical protein
MNAYIFIFATIQTMYIYYIVLDDVHLIPLLLLYQNTNIRATYIRLISIWGPMQLEFNIGELLCWVRL